MEAQIAGSYYPDEKDLFWYTHHPQEVMQKPSVGFDYLSRIGSDNRDYGYISLQARLAYDEYRDKLQAQLYNAFIDLKLSNLDMWLGHNKPAIGLSSNLDNHALLQRDLSMSGLNFDRDWGTGIKLSRINPSISASLTTGSGMPLRIRESYLLASRIGWGDLPSENYSIGFSASGGEILKTMGYEIMHDELPHSLYTAGLDFSGRLLNNYVYTDFLYGSFHEKPAYAGFVRFGYNLLPEERLAIEAQAYFQELAEAVSQEYSLGMNWRISADFTLRTLYSIHQPDFEHKIAMQIYYLKGFSF
ncbi:MAG: hypothetical protein PHO32_09190 [Candidatus Cloacimonetes bacterium]|nr:hypothetical protein [Candidatus Cloacimonadota bacterium]